MSILKKKKSGGNYLSGKEVRAIAKENAKVMKELEAYKNRKCDESEYLTEMKGENNILEIDNLHSYFFTEQGVVKAVNGVSFDIPKNKTVGIVGESGCGKSVTSMSVMRLLQGPTGQIVDGEIRFHAKEKIFDIAKMPMRDIHKIRGSEIAMIFQEPMTSLNPIFTIGEQLDEVTFINKKGASKEEAKAKNSLNNNLKIPFSMFLSGYKYNEIAEKLDVPLGTVKSRIFFARQELQKILKDFH